ncbi:tetratricopeptide repeat protein [Chryseobacterium antibioticum]|uniref:Tetratricopeptide repeat protein n=1 Tax=Chryseobacterium pyrolae TaxID=2987481 RepID=A0ABT2IKE3_9FLAO|nr:tetratricopeptide repeat protein [Chryseobacterium pyrolae]MCT2409125.1 tetratricopeptide repeat protein [Chryseobacterium pyrolae]
MKKKIFYFSALFFLSGLLFILTPNFFFSQTGSTYSDSRTKYTKSEIDSLQDKVTNVLRDKGEFQKLILLNQKVIKASKKIGYGKGIGKGYIKMANTLLLVGNNKESLQFLKLAEKEDYVKQDDRLLSELYVEYGRNYEILGFYKKANQCFDKGIYYGCRVKDAPNYLSYAYSYKAISNNVVTKFPDSVIYYLHKAYKIKPSPLNAGKISFWHINNNRLDSAEYYIKEAWNKAITQPNHKYQKGSVLWGMGNVYFVKKDYGKAVEYYQQSLDIYTKMKRKEDMRTLYQMISNSYDSMGEPKKAKEYLAKYVPLNDSLNAIQKQVLDISLVQFLEEEEQQNQSSRQNLYYIIGGIFIISIAVSSLGFFYYRKNKKKGFLLKEKKIMIVQKDKEVEVLKQKINESFEEIIQLVKENSPEFWGRFQEIYPEFREKILKINPNLRTSELILCAYIYLGFNTKDISEYTFKAVQTIKNNKYNLRKRLFVPAKDDMMLWFRNNIDD